MKKLALIALLASSLMAQAGFAKELKVATNATYAPFEFVNSKTGEIVGFEMDLIHAMAKVAGYEIKMQNMDFDGIIPSVMNGMVDVGAAGFAVNEKRKQKVDFVDPFYQSGLAIIINKSSAGKIKSIDDLKGKKIAAQMGTIGHDKAKTVPDAKVTAFNQVGEALMELSNEGVDAVINSKPATEYMLTMQPRIAEKTVILPGMISDNFTAMIVKKGNTQLLNEMNAALKTLKENGEYVAIYKKWFGTEPDWNWK